MVLFHLLFWVEQLGSLPFMFYGLWLEKTGRTVALRRLGARRNRFWARWQLATAGIRVRVHGAPDVPGGRGALIVSNHQGPFDIPLLGLNLGRDVAYIGKIELTRAPIITTWMRFMGCRFLDRADRRQSLEVIKAAAEDLRAGAWIVIFPEGTRSRRQEMGEFKKGSVSLAARAGVPVIPVAISNSWKVQGSSFDPVHPGVVDVHILPSIDTATLSPEQVANLAETLQASIARCLEKS